MKKIIYSLCLFLFLLMLTSVVSSIKNTTIVLPPPPPKTLILPDEVEDYQITVPEEILNEMADQGWSPIPPDLELISDINNDVATLGRVLFYDDRLSGDNSISCGSCHKQEFSFGDNVPLSVGINDSLSARNTMVLSDVGWKMETGFFWDARSDDLESAVLEPILAGHELGKEMPALIMKLEEALEYEPLFEAAYGNAEITEERITNSLAQFIVSIASFDSKIDSVFIYDDMSLLTESEISGLNLFDTNCDFCHFSPHFGSANPFITSAIGNNGLDSVFTDIGMGAWHTYPVAVGLFRSPSLRNIELSAPYMHDGRFETLEEVVDFYSEGIQSNENSFFNWSMGMGEDFTGFNFSEEEKIDLLNFLKGLTNERILTDAKWSDPWFLNTSIDAELLTTVKVYPNPVADVVIVELENNLNETFDISIYDLNGQLVNTFKTKGNLVEVPRNNAPSGVYKLIASKGGKQKTFKLIYQ